ncbi:Protein unc-93 A [Branchiostoma belcheri]|nr:Protein unc-93 A [Branchiostoma belcheri]
MDEEPFEDSPKLKDATKESQKEALRRCQMSCDLFEIRQHMQKSCFVGLIGPQNAGKSTLIEKTWGVKVTESWSFMTHTHLYRAKGTDRMVIIDFPGGTSIIDGCGGVSSILVLVMPFFMVMDHDVAQLAMEANKLAKDFYCSILLCISHCGRFTDILKIDPANILFTELVCPDNMESRGVVGPEGVRNWIKDWLIKFDVFTEDEDELYAAVNMTRVDGHNPPYVLLRAVYVQKRGQSYGIPYERATYGLRESNFTILTCNCCTDSARSTCVPGTVLASSVLTPHFPVLRTCNARATHLISTVYKDNLTGDCQLVSKMPRKAQKKATRQDPKKRAAEDTRVASDDEVNRRCTHLQRASTACTRQRSNRTEIVRCKHVQLTYHLRNVRCTQPLTARRVVQTTFASLLGKILSQLAIDGRSTLSTTST